MVPESRPRLGGLDWCLYVRTSVQIPRSSDVISLFDFSDPRDAGAQRLRHVFGAPRQVLVAHALHEVRPVVEAAEAAARAGAWVLGWLC